MGYFLLIGFQWRKDFGKKATIFFGVELEYVCFFFENHNDTDKKNESINSF